MNPFIVNRENAARIAREIRTGQLPSVARVRRVIDGDGNGGMTGTGRDGRRGEQRQ